MPTSRLKDMDENGIIPEMRTWGDILIQLQQLSKEELMNNALVYLQHKDEYIPVVVGICFHDNDVVEDGAVIEINY